MNTLAILGASGHGKVVADVALAAGWRQVVFFDDAWPERSRNGHWDIAGPSSRLLADLPAFDGVIVAIGHNATRWDKHRWLCEAGANLVTLVHPTATVSRFARIGAGSVLMAGAVVNVDAELGEASIVNTGATIDHDGRLGHGVHASPGVHLAGDVVVGALSWLGIGSMVREGVRIGQGVTVGAGAVVVRDVADGLTVIGVPAHPLGTASSQQGPSC
jgi:sugar O-acyltransferase (sialic acid O-acetyltransferase NeuD family)